MYVLAGIYYLENARANSKVVILYAALKHPVLVARNFVEVKIKR